MKIRWTGGRVIGQNTVMFASAALGISIFASTPAMAGGVSGMEVSGNKLVLRFDEQVSGATALMLDGPKRIAFDIEGARTSGGSVPVSGSSAFVGGVRQGQFSDHAARVVIDLQQAAVMSSAQFSADGRSLTVLLGQTDPARYSMAINRGRRQIAVPAGIQDNGDSSDSASLVPAMSFASPPRKSQSITVRIPQAAKGLKLPAIYGPNDSSRPLVVIDAGHGGHDPGAINPKTGQREKDVTLAIARAIRSELMASGRVRVALTRDDDRYLVLQERFGLARKMRADLFISIHADSAEAGEASGATVYTLSETASDREAARLAARENKADIINGINLGGQTNDVSSILIDLTQRETMNLSSNFAQVLAREASPYVTFKKGYHRFASLMVLKAPDMPSVLFETGYISNMDDVQVLASREGQRKIAKGVAQAINVHFARRVALR
jgi:N-acetylmuramoyl-L-alanine amidase